MAFLSNNLSLMYYGGAGAVKRYSYVTTDTLPTVQASGYFDATVSTMLNIGDIIDVTVVDAIAVGTRAAVTGVTSLVVAGNASEVVTTAQATRAGNIIALTTTPHSITAALHGNRIITLAKADGITCTLPLASGTGNVYTFFVLTTITSVGYIIKAASTADSFGGGVSIATAGAGITMLCAATTDTCTMNGTDTGGIIGSWVSFKDVLATKWLVDGFLVSSSTEASPWSAAV